MMSDILGGSMMDDNDERFGNFYPDALFLKAVDLWCYYFATCENFDQLFCRGRTEDGIAIPVGQPERSASSSHAVAANQSLAAMAKGLNISDDVFQSAKGEASRMSYAKQHEFACNVIDYVPSNYKG